MLVNMDMKCSVDGCERKVLLQLFGKWVCGNCAANWDKKNKEKLFSEVVSVNG